MCGCLGHRLPACPSPFMTEVFPPLCTQPGEWERENRLKSVFSRNDASKIHRSATALKSLAADLSNIDHIIMQCPVV